MHRSMNRNRDAPPAAQQRRSRSSHQPYHAITETYSKEVTTRPLGPVENFPPELVNRLRGNDRDASSPPLVRSRENTWTTENFPIVRVPSAQFTDILTELYDYHEVEKYTRRSVSPDVETLRRQSEVKEAPIEKRVEQREAPRDTRLTPPTYQVIPPTPEKNTPRYTRGIPLSNAAEEQPSKRPLPMYEEYVKEVLSRAENKRLDENLNPADAPIPRPRSKSPLPPSPSPPLLKGSVGANNNNLRHIDSSSSEITTLSDDEPKRHVYTHNVYVDSTTGRPYTPGRPDLDEKSCGKLKINVYFKPPHPPVLPVYTLDEIEIENHKEILVPKHRPSGTPILGRADGTKASVATAENEDIMTTRRIPTRTTLLRKENEVVTIPLNRSLSVRHSRTGGRSPSTTERSIPIHVDDGFQRNPRGPRNEHRSVDKGEAPRQRYPSTSSHLRERPTERSASFVSQVPSHKSERSPSRVVQSVSSSRAADVIETRRHHPKQRQSPDELDYGKHPTIAHFTPQENGVGHLPYTRGISKTPSMDAKSERSLKSYTTLPAYPATHERDERYSNPLTVTRQNGTPELPYTRGISKTPSIPDHVSDRSPSKISSVPIPVYIDNGERTQTHKPSAAPSERSYRPVSRGTERAGAPTKPQRARSPSVKSRQSSAQPRPTAQTPYEEVVHIKERYERDETIRRIYPTTTSV